MDPTEYETLGNNSDLDPGAEVCCVWYIEIGPFRQVGYLLILNNYWMRFSIISWIIKTEVCVICRSRRLRQIAQTEVLIIHDIMRKPNSIIVLLYLFHIIHPQKQKWSVQPFCFWEEHSKELSNQADVELDMIHAISAADIAFVMSSSQAIVNWLNALDQSDNMIDLASYSGGSTPTGRNSSFVFE